MRRTVVFTLILFSVVTPVLAVFGIGDVVYDPTNYEEAVRQLVQLQREYQQLVQTYEMIRSQYQQMIWMARQAPVAMAQRYRAMATPWRTSQATNIYGTSGGWMSGINSGVGVSGGYAGATLTLGTYGAALGNIPADQQTRVKASYSTVELADGANLTGMQTLGDLRAHAPAVEGVIQNLEDDSLSSDPAMNTEIAVLNKINAANVIGLRNTQDTNKLLATLAEEQIIEAKRKRDAEASAINEHIRFMAEAKGVMAAQSAHASAAMLAWRMP